MIEPEWKASTMDEDRMEGHDSAWQVEHRVLGM